MLTHLVLLKPKVDLSPGDRQAMLDALLAAARAIPTVRALRIGQRLRHGAGYETAPPDTADVLVAFDFDDLPGLQAYLVHPAHDMLARLFYESQAAAAYDFELVDPGPAAGARDTR